MIFSHPTISFCLCQVPPDAPPGHSYTGAHSGGRFGKAIPPSADTIRDSYQQAMAPVQRQYQPESEFMEQTRMIQLATASFRTLRNLPVKNLQCPHCPRKYVTRSGLKEHVRHKHENNARYRCETCAKGFTIRSHYLDHIAIHAGVSRNVCQVCGKKFMFKSSLNSHLVRFHRQAAQM